MGGQGRHRRRGTTGAGRGNVAARARDAIVSRVDILRRRMLRRLTVPIPFKRKEGFGAQNIRKFMALQIDVATGAEFSHSETRFGLCLISLTTCGREW
jgi:hypothetical protein